MTDTSDYKNSSLDEIKAFAKYISTDADCKSKVSKVASLEDLAAIANDHGFQIDVDFIKADPIFVKMELNRDLEDHELEAIAGGGCVDPDIRTNTCLMSLATDGGIAWDCKK